MKTVDAILNGPDPHFAADGVLYVPGQLVPDVPIDQVSDRATRSETVKVQGADGKFASHTVQRPVLFRPVRDGRAQ